MARIGIVLASLRAEGGPALALALADGWRAEHEVTILLLNDDDLTTRPRFEAIGVPVMSLDVGPVRPVRYPTIAFRSWRRLRHHRFDALVSIPSGVHGAVFLGAMMAGVRRRVVHVGNYPWHWQSDFWKYRLLMRIFAPVTPDAVCVSEHVRQGVDEYFGRIARRIHVKPNGIDLARFPFRPAPRAVEPGRAARVLMVGRLDVGKDHDTLIRSVAILRDRGVAVTVDLVGDGPRLPELEALVRSSDLDQIVRLLGPRLDVPQLLADADVFAFSVRAEEGQGIALLEAMAVGVPIVATDVGACREVVDNGSCGRLVPAEDANAMANAIEALVRRPDEKQRLLGRERVERLYTKDKMAAAYGAILGLAS